MTEREALKQALEALEEQVWMANGWQSPAEAKAITAIKKALAQPTSGDYALGYSIGFGEGHSAREALAQPEQEPCGGCGGSGWVPRDPDIGTDQECFVCDGSGAYPKEPEQEPVAFEKTVCPFCTSEWVTAEQHDRNVDRVEQDPVGWLDSNDKLAEFMHKDLKAEHDKRDSSTPRAFQIPVYTTPPQRKPLTDEMTKQMRERCDSYEMRGAFVDGWLSAEAAHGIKENT